jgi:uncharacterized protein YjbJ (UPF0337 family)
MRLNLLSWLQCIAHGASRIPETTRVPFPGKARETIGKVKGYKNLERKGKLQKDLGRARAVYGNTQEDIKNAKTSG